jgi:voltage-gated potassium channel
VGLFVVILIIASCAAVIVETVPSIAAAAGPWFYRFEVVTVVFFTIEYVLRVGSAEKPWKKALEPLVIIDLLSILPFYVGLITGDMVDLRVLRVLRSLRVLRILKMQRYSNALTMLVAVVKTARYQLLSFLFVALICLILMGSIMYHLEPETFGSIPGAIWWSVVTLTTVGYGDVVPHTAATKAVSGLLMLLGIGVIAIPTGIISSGMVEYYHRNAIARRCEGCDLAGHDADALCCKRCGAALPSKGSDTPE